MPLEALAKDKLDREKRLENLRKVLAKKKAEKETQEKEMSE